MAQFRNIPPEDWEVSMQGQLPQEAKICDKSLF